VLTGGSVGRQGRERSEGQSQKEGEWGTALLVQGSRVPSYAIVGGAGLST